MKTMRLVVILLVAVLLAYAVWRLPGCRQRARDIYRQHAGWTQDARRADPVGFIEYAEEQLNEDLQKFTETRERLNDAVRRMRQELERNRTLLEESQELALEFRAAYRDAEGGSESGEGWPVRVRGAEYTREKLIQQVDLILTQRNNYRRTIEELQETLQLASAKQDQLEAQMASTRVALSTLPSKKEIARVNELTQSTEELLEQVDEVMVANRQVLGSSPVRTVEELAQAADETQAGEGKADATAFLEGGQ